MRHVKSLFFFLLAGAAVTVVSCRKEIGLQDVLSPDEIVFVTAGPEVEVTTKASVVSDASLSSIYVAATTGSAGSESSAWSSYQFVKDGEGVFSGTGDGKWWPASNPGYHFYASNVEMTFAADGTTVSADAATDVVCAYLPDPSYRVANALSFDHVFARLGNVVVSAASGYTITGVSVRIVPKTAGTYNIRTGYGVVDGSAGWSGLTSGSSTEIADATPGTKSNDIYMVPGSYELLASWTATKGDYTQTFTDKSVNVTLVAGKVSAVNAELGGLAEEIKFNVSVTAWDSEEVSVAVPKYPPLTFVILTDGNITWKCKTSGVARNISYSKNGGPWTQIRSTTSGVSVPVVAGDVLRWKGNNLNYATTAVNVNTFGVSGGATFNVYGDVMSLTPGTMHNNFAFCQLFYNCEGLISAEGMVLSSEVANASCYRQMFYGCSNMVSPPEILAVRMSSSSCQDMFSGCSSLTTAPELLATSLNSGCYSYMFRGCTSLTDMPFLPATVLASRCYYSMFNGCVSLSSVYDLPATTLTERCYSSMFRGCTSLATAPKLPAITLADYCYQSMFRGCTSLTTVPELPASVLTDNCYEEMFYGCSNLSYIKCLATDISASDCLSLWVYDVGESISGIKTFIRAAEMTTWPSGDDGIPFGWTVVDAS